MALLPGPAVAQDQVIDVYPSGPTVPANLLRISITFAAPPAGPQPTLALTGAAVPLGHAAFLDQRLWTTDGGTLTLLFDPARLKTGVRANAEQGRVLNDGERIELMLDGVPIKAWTVTPPRTERPDPRRWTVTAPEDRDAPLVIGFDHPIDALDRDLIAVVAADGHPVAGTATLGTGETVWSFRPSNPWRHGLYRIAVSPDLEDPAGNAIAEPFEKRGAAAPSDPGQSLGFVMQGPDRP